MRKIRLLIKFRKISNELLEKHMHLDYELRNNSVRVRVRDKVKEDGRWKDKTLENFGSFNKNMPIGDQEIEQLFHNISKFYRDELNKYKKEEKLSDDKLAHLIAIGLQIVEKED